MILQRLAELFFSYFHVDAFSDKKKERERKRAKKYLNQIFADTITRELHI